MNEKIKARAEKFRKIAASKHLRENRYCVICMRSRKYVDAVDAIMIDRALTSVCGEHQSLAQPGKTN